MKSNSLNAYFDAAYVLTASSFLSRHRHIREEVKKLNMDVSLFFGVDGGDFAIEELAHYPKMRHRGDLGNGLTHYNCWKHCLTSGYKSVLLLEDDILVNANANEILAGVMTNVPPDWAIIHLGVNHPQTILDETFRHRRQVNEYVVQGDNEGDGAWAYALSDRGHQYLVRYFAPDHRKSMADGMTCSLTAEWNRDKWEQIGRGYVAIQQAFRHAGSPSEICKLAGQDNSRRQGSHKTLPHVTFL